MEIFSPSMQKNIRCLILVPDSYSPSEHPLPALYLLHGYSGSYAGWLGEAPQLKAFADTYRILMVFPDGGYDSWYLDSPVDSTVRYETHIAREVVAYVDYYYNTIKSPKGRAITGLSMGGHGAMYLAMRHPDVFGAAGSMAGGLDLQPFKRNNWDLKGVLGNPDRFWNNWVELSAISQVDKIAEHPIPLFIDCGVGDFFLEVNRGMHRKLLELEIPHEYIERPGEHNQAYWSNAVDYQLLFFHKFFERGS